jgi:hypothetical protein
MSDMPWRCVELRRRVHFKALCGTLIASEVVEALFVSNTVLIGSDQPRSSQIFCLIELMTESAPFLLEPADVQSLQRFISKLSALRYCEKSTAERLDLGDLADLQWRSTPIYRSEHLASRDPLALAIDLFLLQGSLSAGELDRLFSRSERDVLIRAGLLAIDDMGMVRARAALFPVGNRLVFSDFAWPELPHPGYTAVPRDYVMAIGLDSRLLGRCTPRRSFRNALDLCTGSGMQALLASSHARQVLASDINPRAARCTRFNAQASGATNLEVVVGDLFEPVRGESFDLITANPPFVPSPFDTLRFRDGGRSGEDIQERLIAGLPHHLAPGGFAQIVTELGESDDRPHNQNDSLVHRLRQWLNGAPMDIHILRLREHPAMKYAVGHAKGDDYQTFLDSTDAWASNLRSQGYARVVTLVISFQWSDLSCGPPWTRIDQSPPPRRPAGAEIDCAFLAERLARRLDCDQFLTRSSLRRTGQIALLEAHVLGTNIRAKTQATLLGQALTIEHQLDPLEREILHRLQGIEVDSKELDQAEQKPGTPVPDLIRFFHDLRVDEPAVISAIGSLLRRQLVRADGPLKRSFANEAGELCRVDLGTSCPVPLL